MSAKMKTIQVEKAFSRSRNIYLKVKKCIVSKLIKFKLYKKNKRALQFTVMLFIQIIKLSGLTYYFG
jgi:hypothetical protein